MIRDRSERKLYRKSPGRQYGYDYDPLHSQSLSTGNSQQERSDASVQSESWGARQDTGVRTGRQTSGPLAPRPDPRRTRQLGMILDSLILNCEVVILCLVRIKVCMRV
jgi:hypothetical protein